MQPPYRKNENSHDGGRPHFRAEIYPEGRSRPAITASLLPKQCSFSPSRNNNFFLILLWTFLCHCFALVSAPKTATWSSLCTACTQTETETEHLRWDLSYLLGLPMSSLCPHRPGHIWAPWSAGEGSSSWLVSRGSKFFLCMKRSSVIKKFSAHPKIKTMLLCSPPLPLQAHVSFAFLTTSAH